MKSPHMYRTARSDNQNINFLTNAASDDWLGEWSCIRLAASDTCSLVDAGTLQPRSGTGSLLRSANCSPPARAQTPDHHTPLRRFADNYCEASEGFYTKKVDDTFFVSTGMCPNLQRPLLMFFIMSNHTWVHDDLVDFPKSAPVASSLNLASNLEHESHFSIHWRMSIWCSSDTWWIVLKPFLKLLKFWIFDEYRQTGVWRIQG